MGRTESLLFVRHVPLDLSQAPRVRSPLMRALPALLQARWSRAQREAAARVAQTPRHTARPPQKDHLRGRQLGLSALQRTA